ncbi:MarR family transcriptional regulator, partial [Streptomyces anulatus]
MPTPEPATVAADLRVAMGKLARRVKQEDRIPHGQVAVLGVLDRDGAMTTSDLAADQRVRPQSRGRAGGLRMGQGRGGRPGPPPGGRPGPGGRAAGGRGARGAGRG